MKQFLAFAFVTMFVQVVNGTQLNDEVKDTCTKPESPLCKKYKEINLKTTKKIVIKRLAHKVVVKKINKIKKQIQKRLTDRAKKLPLKRLKNLLSTCKDKTKNCKGVAVAVVKKLIRKKEGKVSKH